MNDPIARPRWGAFERWLLSALIAASLAAVLFHALAALENLPRGDQVGRFWWGAFTIAYLAVAAVGFLAGELLAGLSRAPSARAALHAVATLAFLAAALGLNRGVVRTIVFEPGHRRATTTILLVVLAAALALGRSPLWRWPRRVGALAVLGATWFSLVGERAPQPVPPPAASLARPTGQRLLLIGVDGADPRTLDRLIAEGELPHIAALREAGVSGSFATLRPTSSPLIWTTMVTGRAPREHGVQGHVFERPRWIFERVPDQGESLRGLGVRELRDFLLARGLLVISPATSRERRVPALWNVTTQFGQPLSVVGWWATWPAEAILGRISSDRINYFRWEARGATDLDRRRITFPDALYPKLQRFILPPDRVTYDEARRFLDVDRAEFERDRHRAYEHHDIRSEFTLYYSQFQTDRAIARYLLESDRAARQTPMDLLVLFRLVDQTSHCCLKFSDLVSDHLGSRPDEMKKYGRVVREAYKAADEAIGELTAAFGPGNVVVVSDHGFERTRGRGAREYAHPNAPPGIFIAAGPAFRRGTAEKVGVNDLMSILLYLKGLPISDEIRAPLRQDLFTDEFRAATPVLRVPSFGTLAPHDTMQEESSADQRLLEELKALGYIQ